jgi:hypothetical protein
MTRLIDNLGLNFSNEKFNEALDPYGNLNKSLIKTPSPYKKWQFDAVANDDINGYFKNPMLEISQEIRNAANTMYTASKTVPSLSAITTASGNLAGFDTTTGVPPDPVITTHTKGIIEFFIPHTNNISGVTASTSSSFPDFNSGMAIGEYMMQLTNRYDGVEDASAALGAFTSLFIGDELSVLVIKVNDGAGKVASSIVVDLTDPSLPIYSTNLSAGLITTITNDITECYNLINNRYNHDINFFRNSISTMNKFNQISKFNSLSKVSLHLIDKLVGTDKLKNNL